MVTNPKSGLVSPQFHLVFEDNFETVPHLRAGTVPENWAELVASSRENITEGFYDVTKTWFEVEVDPSTDPQATANHQTPTLSASQPNGGPTSSGGSSYPITSDNGLVSGFKTSGDPQQMYGFEPNLEVPRTGVMISSDVVPANGQLEPCLEDLPDNGFLHSEADPETPSLTTGLEETDHNDFRHVDFDED